MRIYQFFLLGLISDLSQMCDRGETLGTVCKDGVGAFIHSVASKRESRCACSRKVVLTGRS